MALKAQLSLDDSADPQSSYYHLWPHTAVNELV